MRAVQVWVQNGQWVYEAVGDDNKKTMGVLGEETDYTFQTAKLRAEELAEVRFYPPPTNQGEEH